MGRWRSLQALSWVERRLLIEAMVVTGLARLALLWLPFRRIAPWLGQQNEETSSHSQKAQNEVSRLIRQAIIKASRHTPWETKCLVQAMTARYMLGRRGVAGTIYLGVAKGPKTSLRAHAWLRTGDDIITGEGGARDMKVISTFAFSGRRPGTFRQGSFT